MKYNRIELIKSLTSMKDECLEREEAFVLSEDKAILANNKKAIEHYKHVLSVMEKARDVREVVGVRSYCTTESLQMKTCKITQFQDRVKRIDHLLKILAVICGSKDCIDVNKDMEYNIGFTLKPIEYGGTNHTYDI